MREAVLKPLHAPRREYEGRRHDGPAKAGGHRLQHDRNGHTAEHRYEAAVGERERGERAVES